MMRNMPDWLRTLLTILFFVVAITVVSLHLKAEGSVDPDPEPTNIAITTSADARPADVIPADAQRAAEENDARAYAFRREAAKRGGVSEAPEILTAP